MQVLIINREFKILDSSKYEVFFIFTLIFATHKQNDYALKGNLI